MEIIDTKIPEVKVIKPQVYEDDRGCFHESFSDKWFRKNVCDTTFVQDNESVSKINVIRGLHYQKPPYAQSKLVRCSKGGILDIAVDIRLGSPTFGKATFAFLSDKNHYQMFIPRGFAHGFLAMSPDTVVQYKVDNPYNKASEGSVNWEDESIGIHEFIDTWFNTSNGFIVSDKDKAARLLKDIPDYELFIYNEKLY